VTRQCLACDRPLTENSRPEREFCSSAGRGRHWNVANPGPTWYAANDPLVRLHWHVGATSLLAGDVRAPATVGAVPFLLNLLPTSHAARPRRRLITATSGYGICSGTAVTWTSTVTCPRVSQGKESAMSLTTLFSSLRSDEDGQGLAEYALILALIAIVAIIALLFLGGQISGILNQVGSSV
jgi:pilus assembly protein Flp/PilA